MSLQGEDPSSVLPVAARVFARLYDYVCSPACVSSLFNALFKFLFSEGGGFFFIFQLFVNIFFPSKNGAKMRGLRLTYTEWARWREDLLSN